MAFPPSKKPGMGVMLGIAPRPARDEPPPAYAGAKGAAPDPDAAQEGQEGDGMCSVMCPKCGESIPLQITADAGGAEPEQSAEAAPEGDMEAAG